mgnify:CR=1 FL=1
MHISSDNLNRKKAKLPKLSRYRSDVTRLIKRYRKKGVKEFGARNEANHDSQATWKSPKRAADEFKIVRRACKGCTIVALDVLDQKGAVAERLADARTEGRLGVAASIEGRLRDLGGTMAVESAPGAGTELEMRVPR